MKIAILSCNTGGGHNAAAAALAEELSARGHESRTYNTLDFLPKGAADLISRGHDFAYRYAPKLYGAGYRMEEKRPSPLLYENSIRGIGPLYEALVDLGADAAICVHVFPAMMMTELRCGYGLRMPTWFVATDFTCDLRKYTECHLSHIQYHPERTGKADKGLSQDHPFYGIHHTPHHGRSVRYGRSRYPFAAERGMVAFHSFLPTALSWRLLHHTDCHQQ